MSCKRIRALNIGRNHWGVRTDSRPIAEVVASLASLARFLIEANSSRVKIAFERVWNLLRSYKTALVLPINFYRTRIKEPVIITRIKSSSNLLIFLFCFLCYFVLTSRIFACCSTCNVLISSQISSACSMSSEIHHLQLRFALFLCLFFNGGWTFGESNNIKYLQISEFQKQSG